MNRCPHDGCKHETYGRSSEFFGSGFNRFGTVSECPAGHIAVEVKDDLVGMVAIPEDWSNIFNSYEKALELKRSNPVRKITIPV